VRIGEHVGPIVVNLLAPELREKKEFLERARMFLLKLVTGQLEEGENEVFFKSLNKDELDFLTTPNEKFEYISPMAALRQTIEFELKRSRRN
jgi:hypothetical protein